VDEATIRLPLDLPPLIPTSFVVKATGIGRDVLLAMAGKAMPPRAASVAARCGGALDWCAKPFAACWRAPPVSRADHQDTPRSNGLALSIDPAGLTPLIRAVVRETLAAVEADQGALPARLAFGEAEAAALLGLHPHQLRDERLRGRIKASVGPGRKILYSRSDLLAYLTGRRWTPVEK